MHFLINCIIHSICSRKWTHFRTKDRDSNYFPTKFYSRWNRKANKIPKSIICDLYTGDELEKLEHALENKNKYKRGLWALAVVYQGGVAMDIISFGGKVYDITERI